MWNALSLSALASTFTFLLRLDMVILEQVLRATVEAMSYFKKIRYSLFHCPGKYFSLGKVGHSEFSVFI